VQGVHRVAREPLEQTVADHRRGAAEPLLGRLEDQVDGPGEAGILSELPRRAEQHHGVAVVPTGVHHARPSRGVRESGLLGDRDRVHVGAKPDRAVTGVGTADRRDHPRAADPLGHLQSRRPQAACDHLGGAMLLEAQFGVGVQITSQLDQLPVQLATSLERLAAATADRGLLVALGRRSVGRREHEAKHRVRPQTGSRVVGGRRAPPRRLPFVDVRVRAKRSCGGR
jgi:hypothetical protein